jgi:uncharacterized damage-inducible protein DinB
MTAVDDRPRPPHAGDERAVLSGFLDFQRATVIRKVQGLSDEQARRSLLPSALTTAAGIIKHLRYVERWWFTQVLAGRAVKEIWSAEDPDAEWRVGPEETASQLVQAYLDECARSRDVLATHDLDDIAAHPDSDHSVRHILVQMIEETARHAGQLDVIRELTDGATGR